MNLGKNLTLKVYNFRFDHNFDFDTFPKIIFIMMVIKRIEKVHLVKFLLIYIYEVLFKIVSWALM